MKFNKKISTVLALGTLLINGLHAAEKKPNIVFLLADDQATRSVGIYGNDDVQTPDMDKLGNDGVIFDNHYDTTSICMASRANIMTGMYEYKTGTNFKHKTQMLVPIWSKSYPVLMREAGYFTGFAGKFGFKIEGEEDGEQKQYFDVWGGSPGQSSYNTMLNESMVKYAKLYPHSTLSYGAFSQDFIKKAVALDKPFCLSISFKAPHRGPIPDPRFEGMYEGVEFTKPANFGREFGEHFAEQSKKSRQYERFVSWGYEADYTAAMRPYMQQVYGIDVALGMIREELEKQNIADNTVIIYTSDNGFMCGSHGYGSKVLPYEESARVPLMIYDPRSPASGKKMRSDALTGNIDFAPTILELAGVPIPDNIDGKSLCQVISDPKVEVHDSLALMNFFGKNYNRYLAVVTKKWKYTYWWFGGGEFDPTEELFNLEKDEFELKNAALNPEDIQALEAMRATYDKHLTHYKQQAVSHNDYASYGKLFDRNVPWENKDPKKKK